jgi:hypothetical protein
MDIANELTQITLGIDRLYRTQAGGSGELDREGLAPVILTNMDPVAFDSWDAADARLIELASKQDQVKQALRRAYLQEMIESLRGLVATFRGDPMSYAERVQRCLRVDATPISSEVMDQHRGEVDRLLAKLGYAQGGLAERVRRWEDKAQVPPGDVPAVLKELLATAHQRTHDKMFPLPAGLDIEPVGVRGVPYSAYCGYIERKLRINVDYVYTRSALKHLACHEAFPGHLVHLHVRDSRTRAGDMPLDAALVVTNSASSAIFEGIGENGIYFLDWIEDSADQLAMALNRVRSAARVNAALMIHQDGKPLEQVKTFLQEACFATPAWVESRVAFLTHRLRAPFIFAYWGGDLGVDAVWRRVEPDARREFFQYLYNNMHTPRTLNSFWPVQDK